MDSDLFLNLGEQRIFIAPNAIKVKTTRVIREKMGDVKSKYSPYNKVPRKPKESGEDWTKRYLDFIGETSKMEEGESPDTYKTRLLNPVDDNLDYTFDALKALAEVFGQGEKVTKDSFEESVIGDVNAFISKILKKAKYPATEFEDS